MIITSAVVVMLLVTVTFANNFLNSRMAENEFTAVEQFMQIVGLQIDDVAWTVGRTQTIRYASKFGQVNFESVALNYTVFANGVAIANYTTGALMFNMPINRYNIGNDYHKLIVPSANRNLLQTGTSAPVAHVFVIEKIPMNDGSYIRVVVAPSLRMLNSTITMGGVEKTYLKLYLPVLTQTTHPRYSQSVTLTGNSVSMQTKGSVNNVTIRVDFPNGGAGFDNSFFKFDKISEVITNIPSNSILELYTGVVIVSLGLHI